MTPTPALLSWKYLNYFSSEPANTTTPEPEPSDDLQFGDKLVPQKLSQHPSHSQCLSPKPPSMLCTELILLQSFLRRIEAEILFLFLIIVNIRVTFIIGNYLNKNNKSNSLKYVYDLKCYCSYFHVTTSFSKKSNQK